MPDSKKTPTQKRGHDGLTERERAFANLRRDLPEASLWEIAQKAGYNGSRHTQLVRAQQLMKKADIRAIIYAPPPPEKELSDEELKALIRTRFIKFRKSGGATDADAIRAGDKLLATISGGYVPVQVNTTGKLTLESLLRAGGGAPEEPALSPRTEGGDES